MTGKRLIFVCGAALLALTVAWRVQAAPVTLQAAEGDMCQSLGYAQGFAVVPQDGTTYSLASTDGELSNGTPQDAGNSFKISYLTDTSFNWAATLGVDAVIVQGAEGSRTYRYDPEALRGRKLMAPYGDSGPIRQVEFCYDYELTVGGEVTASVDRAYQWDLRTATRPSRPTAYIGDSATVEYTVTVTPRTLRESNWAAEAHLYIENHTPFDATIDGVTYTIPDVGEVEVLCNVEFPYALQAGFALACSASTPLPDGRARTGTIEVAASGQVPGGSAPLEISFKDAVVTAVGDAVRVQDEYAGALGSVNAGMSTAPVSFRYERTFECNADAGTHTGTTRIVETGQEVTAAVDVTCLSQGCQPAFWQRAPQLTRWESFTPDEDFDTVFGVDFFDPDITLREALALEGDGVNALAREAAAGLLNAGSEQVRYLYSLSDLRQMVRQAAGAEGYRGATELLAEANGAECPFVRRPVAAAPAGPGSSAENDLTAAVIPAAPANPAPQRAAPTAVPPTAAPTLAPTLVPTVVPTAVPPTPVPTQPPTAAPPPDPGPPDDPGQPGDPPGHDEGHGNPDKGKDKDKDKDKKP